MFLRSTALLLTGLAATSALAQTGNATFDLTLNGKNIGKDQYTLTKSRTGYKVASHLGVATHGLLFDIRDTLDYTDDYTYTEASEANQDSNRILSWTPAKNGKDMTIGVSGGGSVSSSIEPLTGTHPLLCLPAFDAGAAQAALLFIVAHPSESGYTVWLPGYTLSGIGARTGVIADDGQAIRQPDALPPGPQSFNATWIVGPPFTGTLDGKPVTLKSYRLGFGKYRWTFFADESNTLMQVDVSTLPGSYIRSRFKLDKPKS